jgi:hypothetical protein
MDPIHLAPPSIGGRYRYPNGSVFGRISPKTGEGASDLPRPPRVRLMPSAKRKYGSTTLDSSHALRRWCAVRSALARFGGLERDDLPSSRQNGATSGLVEGSLAVERSEAPLNTLALLAGEQHAQLQVVAVVVRRTIGHGRHLCEWMLRPPIPVNLPR